MTAQFQNPQKQADWKAIAKSAKHETTVVYMGLKRLQILSERLIDEGVERSLPVAVVENACCPEQQVITGTVDTIYQRVVEASVTGPALVFIGNVVTARQPVCSNLLHQVDAL